MGTFDSVTANGEISRVFLAGVARPGAPGVVLFHPWWGLNEDATGYAERLAGHGFYVMAPDMYGGQVVATVEDAERLSTALDPKAGDAVALATVDRLANTLGPDAALGALGFSMGAAWSMWCPAERGRLVASVVYYGTLQGGSLTRAHVPVLGHFAETDPYETDEDVAAFEATLRGAGRDVTIHRYPGTSHWFAEPSRDAFRPAAADLAFERTVAFLGERLG